MGRNLLGGQAMTKEQEVIEYFKKQIESCSENADICDDNNFNEEAAYLRKQRYMYKTVLNMLNKYSADSAEKDKIIAEKSAEIEKLEKQSKNLDKQAQQFDAEIEKKNKAINKQLKENAKLQAELNAENNRCMILANNDKFKEQMIDLMAEFIENNTLNDVLIENVCLTLKCKNEECHEDNWKECIKQFFERRVKDESIY